LLYNLDMIKSYKDLDVYQRSKKLYPRIVNYTKTFPFEAKHLRDQMCRAANSIHSNIAEGYGRSIAEFNLYLTRSLGSCNEVISHIEDSVNAEFGEKNIADKLIEEYNIIGKQLYRLRERWK